MAAPHICVVGSLNIDFVTYTPRCPGPGETLTGTSLAVLAGGKGANQAAACGRASFVSPTRQDVSVGMIGAVGVDDPYYASLLRPALEASGVQTTEVDERPDSNTGSATIVVEADGQNRIIVVPGANHSGMNDSTKVINSITRQTLASVAVSTPLKTPVGVVVLQGEIPRDTTLNLLRHFNSGTGSTAHVIFNPAPVFPSGIPVNALTGTSVLIMNETEVIQLSDIMKAEHRHPSTARAAAELRPEDLAPYFHNSAGVSIVLITLGAAGVFFSTKSGRRGLVQGVKVEKVVDTTAAGDTFVGYFATAFARFVASGSSLCDFDVCIEEVVRNANAAAAVCVQRKGAMQSIPFAYECEESKESTRRP